MAKVTRHNHPLIVNARKESYNAGYREGYKNGYESRSKEHNKIFDTNMQELHSFYRTIISELKEKKNHHFESIELVVAESKDMHFLSYIEIRYTINGIMHEETVGYNPDHRFTTKEIVETCNKLLKQMLSNYKGEIE